jgi:hypothetical protein
MTLRLVTPASDLREPFLDMAHENLGTEDEIDFTDALADFSTYLERTTLEQRGLRDGRMPCSHFWLLDGRNVVGTSRVRHSLTAELEREIGHIGYDLRPINADVVTRPRYCGLHWSALVNSSCPQFGSSAMPTTLPPSPLQSDAAGTSTASSFRNGPAH